MLVKACPSLASWYVLSGFLFGNYLFWSSGSIASSSYSRILYKKCWTFCFPFLQTSALLILPCLLVLACSFGRSKCFRCCVYNFFITWWLLSSKERVQWALHWFPFQHTLAHVLIHQRKIDNNLRKEIKKAAILYPTMYFVSSRTKTFISARELFACPFFNTFALGNSLFVSRPFLVPYKKKN